MKHNRRETVKIYLVQHGEAKSEKENPERPLTDRGKQEVESVAHYVAHSGVEVTEILHSGRLRAKQTAELFGQYLLPPQGVREAKGLAPLDDPREIQKSVQGAKMPLMIVGHLPYLSRLASLLVLGTADKEIIKFTRGAVVCFDRSDDIWSIQWALIPELVEE